MGDLCKVSQFLRRKEGASEKNRKSLITFDIDTQVTVVVRL